MRDILLSSVIIYVCKYMEKYTKKASWVCLVASAFFPRPVISACLAGYILGSYKEQAKKWPVICYIGSLALIWGLRKGFDGMVAYALALVVSVVVVIIISIIYNLVIEKQLDNLLK